MYQDVGNDLWLAAHGNHAGFIDLGSCFARIFRPTVRGIEVIGTRVFAVCIRLRD